MKITPLRNIVLIRADKPREKSASGLFIQEEWKSLPPTGTVESVGPDVTTVSPGDRVIFGRYAAVIMEDDLRLIPETHIHATTDKIDE